jgi:hypothetical protein
MFEEQKKISFNLLREEIGASSDLHFIMNIFLINVEQ